MLWLRCRLAAIALIRPLAWEPPYGLGVALKSKKEKRKEKKRVRPARQETHTDERRMDGWMDGGGEFFIPAHRPGAH